MILLDGFPPNRGGGRNPGTLTGTPPYERAAACVPSILSKRRDTFDSQSVVAGIGQGDRVAEYELVSFCFPTPRYILQHTRERLKELVEKKTGRMRGCMLAFVGRGLLYG